MAENTFLVSVADAIGLDPTTGEALFFGKANLTSAFEVSMANTDVRGGKNNPLLFKYMHDRDLMVNIEQAIFGKTFLGLQVGSGVLNGTVNVLKTECITLTAGTGTVSEVPIGNLQVFKADGTIVTVTPTGSNFTVSGGANTNVTVVYRYADTADRIAVTTTTPPDVITLILTAEVRNNKGVVVELLQIEVPSLQLDGNYTLSLTADGVSTEALSGNALAVTGVTCADGDIYAYVTWIPQTATAIPVAFIAATPTIVNPSVAGGFPHTQQLTVYGIRGGILGNMNVTSACTFTKQAGGNAAISVSAGGLVTTTTTTASSTAVIEITYDGLKEYVTVTVVA